MHVLQRDHLSRLLKTLRSHGYVTVGPTVREHAIVYDEITEVHELPEGKADTQEPGSYKLRLRGDRALFGFASTPQSWKRFLYQPRVRLFTGSGNGKEVRFEAEPQPATKYAFIGVRSCDLHAIRIQDKVFGGEAYKDAAYGSVRRKIFIVAVNCTAPGNLCFCASMETGPRAKGGYDLLLTELMDGETHEFAVEVGTERGREILAEVPHKMDDEAIPARVDAVMSSAASRMGRRVNTTNLKESLADNFDHPEWDDVARRCLTCANCTMVCPTCFCSTVEDVTDLMGSKAERWRAWDSCFTMSFAKVAGGNFRPSSKSRYRQWLMHKFSTWVDQFGTYGCVGCGRCIAWCPVGIDITTELESITSNGSTASATQTHHQGGNNAN